MKVIFKKGFRTIGKYYYDDLLSESEFNGLINKHTGSRIKTKTIKFKPNTKYENIFDKTGLINFDNVESITFKISGII